MPTTDNVNHPSHYQQYSREVIELTEKLGFDLGNCVKYILRAPYKGREKEDMEKARWYLRRLVDELDARQCEAQIVDLPDNFAEILTSYRCSIVTEIVLCCKRGDKPGLRKCFDDISAKIKSI